MLPVEASFCMRSRSPMELPASRRPVENRVASFTEVCSKPVAIPWQTQAAAPVARMPVSYKNGAGLRTNFLSPAGS